MLELKHKNLDVWKRSIDLTSEIYSLTSDFPNTETYGLTAQLRRAAVSIPSNIAEGSARRTADDRRRFYEIARSSLTEVDTQIELALRFKYCTQEDIENLEEILNHVFALLSRLIKATN